MPQFWFWDLIVKRADLGIMLIVANTSIADDDSRLNKHDHYILLFISISMNSRSSSSRRSRRNREPFSAFWCWGFFGLPRKGQCKAIAVSAPVGLGAWYQ